MLNLEVRHLRLIDAIVRENSITKASEKLNLTQSALSHQLRDIEEKLGTPLFHRVKKKLVLTRAGETALEAARIILPKLEQVEASITRDRNGEGGVLRLTTQCYTCYHWLPTLLAEYKRDFPKVDVKVVLDATRRPLEELRSGNIDVAITSDASQADDLAVYPLFTDELVLITPRDHLLGRKVHVLPEDFAGERLIIHNDPTSNFFIRRFLQPAGITPHEVWQVQLTEAIVGMVKGGLGISVMADWALAPYKRERGICQVRLSRRGFTRQWSAVTINSGREPKYVRSFVELLIDRAGEFRK
jgi:LysR family transcriptional regulator, regulator for metE and metH